MAVQKKSNTTTLIDETLIALGAARTLIPTQPAARTIRCHAHRGLLDPEGRRVKLETVKIGRKRFTSEQAVRRFILALTEQEAGVISDH